LQSVSSITENLDNTGLDVSLREGRSGELPPSGDARNVPHSRKRQTDSESDPILLSLPTQDDEDEDQAIDGVIEKTAKLLFNSRTKEIVVQGNLRHISNAPQPIGNNRRLAGRQDSTIGRPETHATIGGSNVNYNFSQCKFDGPVVCDTKGDVYIGSTERQTTRDD